MQQEHTTYDQHKGYNVCTPRSSTIVDKYCDHEDNSKQEHGFEDEKFILKCFNFNQWIQSKYGRHHVKDEVEVRKLYYEWLKFCDGSNFNKEDMGEHTSHIVYAYEDVYAICKDNNENLGQAFTLKCMCFDEWLDRKYRDHKLIDEEMRRKICIDGVVSSDDEESQSQTNTPYVSYCLILSIHNSILGCPKLSVHIVFRPMR